MLRKRAREDFEEDTDTMNDDENEDLCQECGFQIIKSNLEDHQYCIPVATHGLGDKEDDTENSFDHLQQAATKSEDQGYMWECRVCKVWVEGDEWVEHLELEHGTKVSPSGGFSPGATRGDTV